MRTTSRATSRASTALRERALAWPPERAAAECGLAAADIRELAREYGTTQPAAIRLNYGMQRAAGGGNAVRLIALLPCLTGAWRHRAGGLLLSASGWFKSVRGDAALAKARAAGRPQAAHDQHEHDRRRSAARGIAGVRPEDRGAGRLQQQSGGGGAAVGRVVQGFAREDLFTVVLEHFMTDTADHADIVLPATTQLEHLDVHISYGHTYAMFNEPAIAPLGEAKPNSQIFRELAQRMGFVEPCFADDDVTLARTALPGVDFDALRRDGWVKLPLPEAPFAEGHFQTPSGKVLVDAPGVGVPDYVPPYEGVRSPLAASYPLAMISPPARNFLNSSFVNVASLREAEREPLLEMHPDDAAARGIADGTMVEVFNERGRYHCRARVGDRARPGVVNGLGVWWRKFGVRGTNVNELTSQRLTDIGRAPTFYDCRVEVRPA